NLLFKERISEFKKTAAEKTDVNNIIKISDIKEKNNLTNISMKKISISFIYKML
ncbi:hypothetical protein BDFG_09208, partial [Blastomyces dermatitidis ATCC 26199]